MKLCMHACMCVHDTLTEILTTLLIQIFPCLSLFSPSNNVSVSESLVQPRINIYTLFIIHVIPSKAPTCACWVAYIHISCIITVYISHSEEKKLTYMSIDCHNHHHLVTHGSAYILSVSLYHYIDPHIDHVRLFDHHIHILCAYYLSVYMRIDVA